MIEDDFSLYDFKASAFEERYFYFWVKCVIEALGLIGPETDNHLENMSRMLLDYYGGADVSSEAIEQIPREIVRLRGIGIRKDYSPIGLKYRCISSLAHSREKNLEDPVFWWFYALNSSFDLINLSNDKDATLNALVRENASNYNADIYETGDGGE